MDLLFRDRDVKVLVVDRSGTSRTLVSEVVRNLGFTQIQGAANLKDALSIMEVEKVGWLITSLYTDQPENILQVLKLFCSHPDLNQLRVSAMVDNTEKDILPDCFERGLFSFHSKPFTKDSLNNELRDLLTRHENYAWNASLTAGSYLRQILGELENYEELLEFERQLLKMAPANLEQYLNLSVPLAKMGKMMEAKSILSQLKQIDASLIPRIKEIESLHLTGQDLQEGSESTVNILGLKTAIIVDNDSIIQNEIKAALEQMGVESVHVFDDGVAAFDYVQQNNNPDLIIQEWRIPKMTGPLFLQKVKEEVAKSTPIILVSSLIKKEDSAFVREMGVACVLPKPFQRKELVQAILWTIQQDRQPTEQVSLERKMRQLLGEQKQAEAQLIKSKYLADSSIRIGSKKMIEAEFAYALGRYEQARDFCIESIKHGAGESIFILNMLGKALINLREFETALKCFQRAKESAPMNIERLCQIAEIHSELGNDSKAKEVIGEAKKMDSDNRMVKESEIKLEFNTGNSASAKKLMGQLKAIENVLAYMNNRSVALVRSGKIDEGIEGHKNTIDSVPDDRIDIKGIAHYNLALAYVRANRLPEAKLQLEIGMQCQPSKVQTRAAAIHQTVSQAIARGISITIANNNPPAVPDKNGKDAQKIAEADSLKELVKEEVANLIANSPGEMACYLIYKRARCSPLAQKMLEGQVRFTPRKAIEKRDLRKNA